MRFMGAILALSLIPLVGAYAQDEGGEEASGGFEVYELILSKGVEGGQPVDPGTSFSRTDGRIYATIRIRNPEREETSIRVAWQRADDGPTERGIELDVPGRSRYRTTARTGTGRSAGNTGSRLVIKCIEIIVATATVIRCRTIQSRQGSRQNR